MQEGLPRVTAQLGRHLEQVTSQPMDVSDEENETNQDKGQEQKVTAKSSAPLQRM